MIGFWLWRVKMGKIIILGLLLISASGVLAQTKPEFPLSRELADTAMNRIWVDDGNPPGIPRKWTYDQGVINRGLEALWSATGDKKYFDHIKTGMDFWLSPDGT